MSASILGPWGVWVNRAAVTDAVARDVERLGYTTLWIGGSPGAGLDEAELALAATERLVVATGVVNIWQADAVKTAASARRLEERFPGRFVLGIGSGHREHDAARESPLRAIGRYLDVLDAEGIPPEKRIVAALGPKTMALAAERSLGIHPYLTLPAHTRFARELLGPDAVIAAEQMVVASDDAVTARRDARAVLGRYLALSNYVTTLERFGVDAADLADGGSDDLVDRLTPWGSDQIRAAGLTGHRDAGADHVCVQVLPVGGDPAPTLAGIADVLGVGG